MTTEIESGPSKACVETPLYVRTIADALCRHLEAANTSVHWAQAAGGETSFGPPKLTWPDDPNIGYMIQDGNNEGSIVNVYHRQDLYGREPNVTLISIKFLYSMKKVFHEAIHVMEFIDSIDIEKMMALQKTKAKQSRA